MHPMHLRSFPFAAPSRLHAFQQLCRRSRPQRFLPALVLATLAVTAPAQSNSEGSMPQPAGFRALPNHVPSWANERNLIEAVPAGQPVGNLTLVLAMHPEQQKALDKLLAEQQDPASPEYHQWLTPSEFGDRFGIVDQEIDALTGWLESQGLHVDWVAPGRNFIGFSGAAGDVGQAFHTKLNYYSVHGSRRYSIASPPSIPAEIASLVTSIHGLHAVENRPMNLARKAPADSPLATGQGGTTFIAPADFATIYNLPTEWSGSGVTIGIVGRARVDTADLTNFEKLTSTSFDNPVVVVPTAFGGVDPGPPYTSVPSPASLAGDQSEATLDVMRAATVAPKARILLVVTKSNADGGSDIGGDTQYLVQTDPVPAHVINISFGACEYENSNYVGFWDQLFQQATTEGISVFVSSGDSGAAGCDAHGQAPPAQTNPISPNYICSSSYATCVGGTEFNDAADPGKYWNSQNGPGLLSALGYIPEGAWNEPLTNGQPQAASSGGGVSSVVATPSWQTGKGVPSAHHGRYTPDIAFSASGHDGYLACFAAGGGGCTAADNGSVEIFWGTSAAAPDMAGIAALLDQRMGKAQGNLNPRLYAMAASVPSAFHDVTVATSGVGSCSVNTPSMCNNSIPGPSGLSGGQAGYLVGPGYDEVTGLGSLNVANFIDDFGVIQHPPAVATKLAIKITASTAALTGTVNPEGQATQFRFYYGTKSTLAGARPTKIQSAGSGTSAVTVTWPIAGLAAGTTYYFRLDASNAAGTSTGTILKFTSKKVQTISFKQPASPVKPEARVALSAKSTSGLPVIFVVTKGHAKVSGSELTPTAVGTIVVEATQSGNGAYEAATPVERTIVVN
jgi:subtilase family serine protease